MIEMFDIHNERHRAALDDLMFQQIVFHEEIHQGVPREEMGTSMIQAINEDLEFSIREILLEHSAGHWSVIFWKEAGNIVGLAVTEIRNDETGTQSANDEWYGNSEENLSYTMYVHELVIDEKHRGHGSGKQFLMSLENEAEHLGCESLTLHCAKGNNNAQLFFANSIGMNGYEHDTMTFMRKELQPYSRISTAIEE